jgi:hypothetical protein
VFVIINFKRKKYMMNKVVKGRESIQP